jgi:hypothetical protein
MTDPVDRRTGGAAVAAGVLLFASVAAELAWPAQDPDGSVAHAVAFVLYLAAWTVGAACLAVAVSGLRGATTSRPGRVGCRVSLAGAALFVTFGGVALGSALLTGAPADWSFLLFAVGLLLLVAGAVPLALGLRRTLPGWWTAVLVAGAGAAVALLVEPDPWHDLGLFVFDAAWLALGLAVLGGRVPAAAPDRRGVELPTGS